MTERRLALDEWAAVALPAYLADAMHAETSPPHIIARDAFGMARAMLAESERRHKQEQQNERDEEKRAAGVRTESP